MSNVISNYFGQFTFMPWKLMKDKNLKPTAKLVYCVYASHLDLDKGASCFPSVHTVAEEAGVSRPTVTSALKELVSKGYLKREQPNAGGKVYTKFLRLIDPSQEEGKILGGGGQKSCTELEPITRKQHIKKPKTLESKIQIPGGAPKLLFDLKEAWNAVRGPEMGSVPEKFPPAFYGLVNKAWKAAEAYCEDNPFEERNIPDLVAGAKDVAEGVGNLSFMAILAVKDGIPKAQMYLERGLAKNRNAGRPVWDR